MYSKDAADVIRELAELRRGRGLDATDLHLRVGPLLRAACGIADSDTPSQLRRKLILRLTALCGGLPDDLKLAALAALALHGEAASEFLDRRIAWLAAQYRRDPRTARRRVDQAFLLLGERLQGHEDGPDNVGPDSLEAWYVERLVAVLNLDSPRATLNEERGIVSTVDELNEIVVALSVPRNSASSAGSPIDAKMLYGGEIVEREQVSLSHARFVVRLPKPLRLGQRHGYGIEFSAGPRVALRPYYVLTPLCRCEFFSVKVRFGEAGRPEAVWRVNGLPARVVDDFLPNGDLLAVDSAGEAQAEFRSLRQGLSYGLQWRDLSTIENG